MLRVSVVSGRRLAAEMPVFTGGGRRAHGEGQKGARSPYGYLAPS